MKKIVSALFALAMLLSVVFIGEVTSSNNPLSVSAQSMQSTVGVKRKKKGIARRTYGGGKYVVRRTWDGTKYVSRRVWVGTKWTAHKTKRGTKWTAHKTKRGTKKVISRTKKVLY